MSVLECSHCDLFISVLGAEGGAFMYSFSKHLSACEILSSVLGAGNRSANKIDWVPALMEVMVVRACVRACQTSSRINDERQPN